MARRLSEKHIAAEQFNLSNERAINSEILAAKPVNFGVRTGHAYLEDPKHLLFNLSRYKFVSKMFAGYENVLEIGCGDAFGTGLVAATVARMTATDLEHRFVRDLGKSHAYAGRIRFKATNFIEQSLEPVFDAAFSLDVLEHIPKDCELRFMQNVVRSMKANGDCIIGMPSLESQRYASHLSKVGHVNCKTADELKALMRQFFLKVFIFSMNDEVLHTGFHPMSHYLLALCVGSKSIK